MKEDLFVGREAELNALMVRLEKALAGRGQIYFVLGQAGSGKTYLVHHFVEQALDRHPELVVIAGSSNAQTGIGDPYLPFREALGMLAGKNGSSTARQLHPENTRRLQRAFVRSVQILVEVAPELVGLFIPLGKVFGLAGKALAERVGWMDKLETLAEQETSSDQGSPLTDQHRIFEKFTAFIQELSAELPLILFLDDLQWADNASIGLLFHLARHIEDHPVFILGAYRPDDVALGRNGDRHPLEPVVHELTRYYGGITLDLDLIPEGTNRAFLDALLDAEPNRLGEDFRAQLFHRTGGHALFTVELLREMQDRGDLVRDERGRWVARGALDWDALPARVEGVIAERLGRLEEDLREILTIGSVEGEEFTAEVVARVQEIVDRQAIRLLSAELGRQHRLVSAQGLRQLGRTRLSLYRFVHSLFQHYIYDNLAEAERRYLHRDVGQVLELLVDGKTDPVAADLARHFDLAGVYDKAAAYRLQAGGRAWRMAAPEEAMAHLERGLNLLPRLPEDQDMLRLEFDLQKALGTVCLAAEGYASPRVERAFERAGELARVAGDPEDEIPVLYGLSAYHFGRAELSKCYQEAKRLQALCSSENADGFSLGAKLVMGASSNHLVQFERARDQLESVVKRYDMKKDHALTHILSHDPGVGALSYLAIVLWHLGFPEQAAASADQALQLAGDLGHPFSLGYAASFSATMYGMLRDWPTCRTLSEKALHIGEEGPFPSWMAMGKLMKGFSLAKSGSPEEGILTLQEGMDLWASTGARLAVPYQRTLLAEAYLEAGKKERGLASLGDAFNCPWDKLWWLPEQHRVRAELLLLDPPDEAAAASAYSEAVRVAQEHGNRAAELRAATGWARLLRRRGDPAQARVLLGDLFASFTEGFDVPDLREAQEQL